VVHLAIRVMLRKQQSSSSLHKFSWKVRAKQAGKLVVIESVSRGGFHLENFEEVVKEAQLAQN
jgi:hypothetical protein